MTFVKKLIKAPAKKFQIQVYTEKERKREGERNVNIITINQQEVNKTRWDNIYKKIYI